MRKRCFFIGTPGANGPVGRHFITLAEELARRGNNVKVFLPRGAGPGGCRGANLESVFWPSARPTRPADGLFLAKMIAKHNPDCLYANFAAVNWMTLIGWILRVRRRIVFYHTLSHQLDMDYIGSCARMKLLRLRKRCIFSLTTHLAANSIAASKDLQHTFGVPQSKCVVQHLGLPDLSETIAIKSVEERGDFVVCAGRLHPSKGQQILVEALSHLPPSLGSIGVQFLGSGPLMGKLREVTALRGLGDRCTFSGAVSREEVVNRMANAKAVVVPSLSEAYGLVNIEAMSVATPVIASSVGGIPEIVRDGHDGFLFPAGDARSLSDKLALILSDSGLRKRMGSNARKRFLHDFEIAVLAQEQANFLENLN